SAKTPVVRGARACTVCRAAKMKCVGAEDGQKKCQRCKRANAECIFEKHRRGRKPGSKLSEASKMLRRLEKGLNSAKMKSQSADPARPSTFNGDAHSAGSSIEQHYQRTADVEYSQGGSFSSNEINISHYPSPDMYAGSSPGSRHIDPDEDDEKNEETLFPAKLIKKENERNSFFRTILNPEPSTTRPTERNSYTSPQPDIAHIPDGLNDPITAGIITEDEAKVLFDLIFLRLNSFICLFDPSLHSVGYVRARCPFLFTTLIMAGCKFFKPEKFKDCQKLANDLALRAFADAWKRVEVVQAFACLTYWQDPDDNRTWTYIGYACRMAVELGLNRYVAHPSANESEFQRLERRNSERTYLVLFVHDRSLSTQTGRHWMLPEDELIRHSNTWHQEGGGVIRAEDVIIAAFVHLRRIAAETTDVFHASKHSTLGNNNDINFEVLLRNCNNKLTDWDTTWRHEMERANGTKFHFSFLSFFRLYVRLFLNSFGIQSSMASGSRQSPSLQALSVCCTSALDLLRVVSRDFVSMSMLSYTQETITVMTAYSAVFLLKVHPTLDCK
ncbi:fungal-specific transcription factor domain-containing protein, partial [Cyathus striatus]